VGCGGAHPGEKQSETKRLGTQMSPARQSGTKVVIDAL
jgi:hypothetical protein